MKRIHVVFVLLVFALILLPVFAQTSTKPTPNLTPYPRGGPYIGNTGPLKPKWLITPQGETESHLLSQIERVLDEGRLETFLTGIQWGDDAP